MTILSQEDAESIHKRFREKGALQVRDLDRRSFLFVCSVKL